MPGLGIVAHVPFADIPAVVARFGEEIGDHHLRPERCGRFLLALRRILDRAALSENLESRADAGRRPVKKVARLGEQIGEAQNAFAKRSPPRARLSIFGVLISLLP